jgi:hypothetical protein
MPTINNTVSQKVDEWFLGGVSGLGRKDLGRTLLMGEYRISYRE